MSAFKTVGSAAFLAIKRDAAAGADGETWRHYRANLEGNLQELSLRLKRGGTEHSVSVTWRALHSVRLDAGDGGKSNRFVLGRP
jgi:hypothetical protein